jgi:hypothetical protein
VECCHAQHAARRKDTVAQGNALPTNRLPVSAKSTSGAARGSAPAGWVVLPGPEAPAPQVRRLAQIIEAFHCFAPLRDLHELTHVDEQLARTISTVQRIRPMLTEELFGAAIALIPPATFVAPAPGGTSIEATMPPRPQCWPQYRRTPRCCQSRCS